MSNVAETCQRPSNNNRTIKERDKRKRNKLIRQRPIDSSRQKIHQNNQNNKTTKQQHHKQFFTRTANIFSLIRVNMLLDTLLCWVSARCSSWYCFNVRSNRCDSDRVLSTSLPCSNTLFMMARMPAFGSGEKKKIVNRRTGNRNSQHYFFFLIYLGYR